MIRFVDLDTGNTFDGHNPYIFWFDGGQSTGLIYTKKICFISLTENINVNINDNNIFSLVNTDAIANSPKTTLGGVSYSDINSLKTNTIISKGCAHHNYWVHMIYIMANADQAGEYLESITIDGDTYTIGADFYDADESLYINLSNNGIEIPNSIQKAIYDMNIYEERRDNILLNRKWKELLSNLWDTIANRGSYKSLFNSLKWFEYGDLLTLCEIWKRNDDTYFIRDIQSVLGDKYFETLTNTAKTTYIALYLSLEKIVQGQYDEEKNPVLEYISTKWSTEELSLKLSLLGNFFKTYFMPIHLDLIHSTIEDVVYTNTIKSFNTPLMSRSDYLYDVKTMKCNIDENVFQLGEVESFVGPNTIFGSQYGIDFTTEEDLYIVGVQKKPVYGYLSENAKKTYTSQLFKGIGSIIDFEFEMEDFNNDLIKKETIILTFTDQNGNKTVIRRTNHKLIRENKFQFSILCRYEGTYDVNLQMDSADGYTYIKNCRFYVVDTNGSSIKIYKIHNIQSGINGITADHSMYQIQQGLSPLQICTQYIPCRLAPAHQNDKLTGIRLNHMLIMDNSSQQVENDMEVSAHLSKCYEKILIRGNYIIYLSKKFDEYPEFKYPEIYNKMLPYIYKQNHIYVPEKHIMVELNKPQNNQPESIEYYTITDDDALCVIPSISCGLKINEPEWEFRNVSTGKNIVLANNSIQNPFIANTEKSFLDPGYYDIIFRYKLGDKINEVTLESAFVKR